ncbi:hypothetical protein O3M35_007802 [Rhynocoris fuscipes]|uniref:Uncharacterized protein n=1 Tax=Rhynocoris fuscipes TaxID=488301 RepID=A0AAW1DAK2_9HEMI
MAGRQRKACPPGVNDQPGIRIDTLERLQKLRVEMRKPKSVQKKPLDAYIVTGSDEHQSEFLSDRDQRLLYISGYTGSRAMAVITNTKAAIWVPEIDVTLANEQLSCDWLLNSFSISIQEWLHTELPNGGRVGANPTLISNSEWEILSRSFSQKYLQLLPITQDLVDLIWFPKPNGTMHEAQVWPIEYAGRIWQDKVAEVRDMMKNEGCDALVITALDEIAWLLNIRGRDIPYFPAFKSYVIITRDQLNFYADQRKIGEAVRKHLQTESCITPKCFRERRYESVWEDLTTLSQIWRKVWIPSSGPFAPGVSRAVYISIPEDKRMSKVSPIIALKAEKNQVERDGMRRAHVQDAVAFCDFMAYFEEKMRRGEKWDEQMVASSLDEFRREQVESQGISFRTIVAFGSHSAIHHYEANNVTSTKINNSNILLIDSGGQYTGGTTDVTRVLHFGNPSAEQIEIYTRVLMGLIDLASLVFPPLLPIKEVDILARRPLWELGLDYHHATSHGIGAHLSIHEGPILISRKFDNKVVFKLGQFFSDEPGYIKDDKYGIRLGNILEVVWHDSKNDSHDRYMSFNPVTLVPFEPKLINLKLLSPRQVIKQFIMQCLL